MSLFLRFNEKKSYYESTFEGVPALNAVVDEYRGFYSKEPPERFANSELREFVDLSSVSFDDISTSGVRDIAGVYSQLRAELRLEKITLSIFAPSDMSYGMARVFLAWAEEGVFDVGVFRGRDEAEKFLASG